MPENVIKYNLLISCPGDIQEEIHLVEKAVEKFNNQFSDTLGIIIKTKHWSKNSYAQSGGTPQELLNNQFVKGCDAAVALFWTRFGTPTDQYGSGTEEEIELMLDAGKQVFLYFSEKPIPPSKLDSKEYARVNMFKEKYKDRGIYFCYSSNEEFTNIFFAHLTQHFLSIKAVSEVKSERSSRLVLRGLDKNKKICCEPCAVKFQLNSSKSKASFLTKIKELYLKVNSMHFENNLTALNIQSKNDQYPPSANLRESFFSPVTIEEPIKKNIRIFAEELHIPLEPDFFHFGNLRNNILSISVCGKPSYDGTPDEQLKYKFVMKLYALIIEYIDWSQIENAYSILNCINLAIENDGTAVDEDVEVELQFALNVLLPLNQFPVIKNDSAIKYMLDDCGVHKLLSIPATAQYKAFQDSQKPMPFRAKTPSSLLYSPFSSRNYKADYANALADTYCYDFYQYDDKAIMKVKFDYIKHHTVIAFPTPIFFQTSPHEIEYTITSKNSADIISGKMFLTSIPDDS